MITAFEGCCLYMEIRVSLLSFSLTHDIPGYGIGLDYLVLSIANVILFLLFCFTQFLKLVDDYKLHSINVERVDINECMSVLSTLQPIIILDRVDVIMLRTLFMVIKYI